MVVSYFAEMQTEYLARMYFKTAWDEVSTRLFQSIRSTTGYYTSIADRLVCYYQLQSDYNAPVPNSAPILCSQRSPPPNDAIEPSHRV